jgi:uncharacterized protein YcbK (DUF882 family)
MLSIKVNGKVSVKKMTPQILLADIIVSGIYKSHGYDCVITSGCDGDHMNGSLHYNGNAHDYRISNIDISNIGEIMLKEIREALGNEYDVILEKNHFHVEYDPK